MDFSGLKNLNRLAGLSILALLPLAAAAQVTPTGQGGLTAVNQPSRWDIFVGYSYLSPHGSVTSPYSGGPYSYDNINFGGIVSVARFFNKNVGLEFTGDAHSESQDPHGTQVYNSNDDFSGASGGVVFRIPMNRATPFLHADFGGERVGGPNDQADTWGPVVTAGGGVDYLTPAFHHHMSIRIIQADYQYTHINFGNTYYGGVANPNIIRLSAGVVFKQGSVLPPPPIILSCYATPTSIFPGDPVTITATPGELNPKLNAIYTWSGDGVTGTGTTANVSTGGLAPGAYQAKGVVKEGHPGREGLKPGQTAECTAGFTVKAYEPPTLSCSANPTSLNPGGTSTITAQGISPQNRPLTYSYSASAGTVNGGGQTAQYSSAGAPTGPVNITCNVQDDKGQTATATTSVTITAPYVPPAPHTQALCSISFANDPMRPTRVDNEAKACLDQVAIDLQNQADSKLVLVGQATTAEKAPPKRKRAVQIDVAAQRAVNTKDYLVKEKGIDPSRISVVVASADGQTVEDYLVPTGATFATDVQGTTPVDELTIKAQPRKPLHR
jgi:hypothetical protein